MMMVMMMMMMMMAMVCRGWRARRQAAKLRVEREKREQQLKRAREVRLWSPPPSVHPHHSTSLMCLCPQFAERSKGVAAVKSRIQREIEEQRERERLFEEQRQRVAAAGSGEHAVVKTPSQRRATMLRGDANNVQLSSRRGSKKSLDLMGSPVRMPSLAPEVESVETPVAPAAAVVPVPVSVTVQSPAVVVGGGTGETASEAPLNASGADVMMQGSGDDDGAAASTDDVIVIDDGLSEGSDSDIALLDEDTRRHLAASVIQVCVDAVAIAHRSSLRA